MSLYSSNQSNLDQRAITKDCHTNNLTLNNDYGKRMHALISGMMIDENGVQTKQEIDYYVRYLDRTSEMSVPKQIEILKRSNNFNLVPFGGAMIVAIDAQKYYDETYKAIMESESNILQL